MMESVRFILFLVAIYSHQTTAHTTGNKLFPTQKNAARTMTSVEPVHSSVETATPPTNPRIIHNDRDGNDVDVLKQAGTPKYSESPKVLQKRSVGKIFLELVPSLLKDLFGLSPREVENQGLTQKQMDALLLAIAESCSSGARGTRISGVIVLCMFPVLLLGHFLGIRI